MKTILYIDHSESYKVLLQEELSEERHRVITVNNIFSREDCLSSDKSQERRK
jgi:hypothetical protein